MIEYRVEPAMIEWKRGYYVPNAFTANPMVSVCPGGARIDVIESPAPAHDSASYRIRRFSPDGALLGPVVVGTIKARSMPPGFVDSVQRRFVGAYIRRGDISESDYMAIVHRAIPQRRFARAFDNAMCAGDGALWLHLAGGGQSWVILDTSNVFTGSVDLPPNSRPGYATRDRVWLIQRDEFDVPSIVRYKLERPKAR